MKPFFDLFLNLLFPRRCLSCGRFGEYLCPSCASGIQYIEKNICPVCEQAAIGGGTHPRCKTRYSLDGLVSIFGYQGVVKEAIKRIKYKPFAFDIGQRLTFLALKKIAKDPLFSSFALILKKKPTLVPVPLHRQRERKRGFNQADILGKALAKEWGLSYLPDLLLRIKKTKPQVKLKGSERKKNLRGAFRIRKIYLSPSGKLRRGLRIILFDDVWTTGTTLRACGNVLKRGGAEFVWGLTLAR